MGSKVKLSPAMQAEMWNLHSEETGGPVMAGTTDATAHALSRRGLFSLATRTLTDAGRTWIAEQIEAARVEALWENVNRHERGTPERVAAALLAARWGLATLHPQFIFKAWREALIEHGERALAAASKMAGFCGTLDAQSAALALGARWGVYDCPTDVIERDHAEALEENWRNHFEVTSMPNAWRMLVRAGLRSADDEAEMAEYDHVKALNIARSLEIIAMPREMDSKHTDEA